MATALTDQDKALSMLREWAAAELCALGAVGFGASIELIPISGDAGFRQYYKVGGSPEYLAVYAPPAHEKNAQFVQLAEYFREHGIACPRVHAFDLERGFLLVENLGDKLMLPALNADSVSGLYGAALQVLLRLQQVPVNAELLAPYDEAALMAEMQLCETWFFSKLLSLSLDSREREIYRNFLRRLLDNALAQRVVPVHRDFHSRNLILRDGESLGVVDFQDAVAGPITYDLVSLLKDCYIKWPRDLVRQWVLAYQSLLLDVGLLGDQSSEAFYRDFEWIGLQRHIKVLGIFSRLYLRDNKAGYLRDLPRVLDYVLEALAEYPEFSELRTFFLAKVLPAAQRCDWYSAS